MHTVAEMTRRRGLVILISDLLDDVGDVQKGLAHLKYLSHDVIVFHTLDRQERRLDYDGLVEFVDLESRQRIRTFPKSLRETYQGKVDQFVAELKAKGPSLTRQPWSIWQETFGQWKPRAFDLPEH